MDKNVRKIMDIKLERTKKALLKNNMNAEILDDERAVLEYLKTTIEEGTRVSVGGSQTLFECGIIEALRKMPITFEDRYEEGLSREAMLELFRHAFTCDYYISSSNAVSENGELYNVDGTGNRVAALTFGPKKVFLVVGENKIVKDLSEAIARIENIAAPMNSERLDKKTPCTVTGSCSSCMSEDRICTSYVATKKQQNSNKGRITVLLVKKSLGY
ncbi:hypothetical protein M2475_000013 [Breznakia sp. PF5-3]|uniref:lactate utilization protein n=1 Tax=unclassified Breznakia TaxID=2623764 RepID=UPI002405DB89|nr:MULTISPECIES: lactate utilization protein [unclassified Breznakia]MDF9823666.1 hypothetical protein [Breznakia sp. PM6-1]MDF9834464.1 hypothetical protein [Breznakia sp. PF5-3]MDF9838621.1 hypothetical protein [Breznakia sp. PFB2-8]MDF9860642.1 hypothetical protein [Breznakia sp. PH5-24]